jgi:hypothetical protein
MASAETENSGGSQARLMDSMWVAFELVKIIDGELGEW